MGKKNDRLTDLLERLLRNEEVESCLKDIPEEEADEIRLLLKTDGVLTRYTETIEPRPEFTARIQSRLEEACELKYGSGKTGIAGILKPAGRWLAPVAIAAVMALFTLTGGLALADVAAKNATPGQTLYPVKVAAEKVKAAFSFSGTRGSSPVQSGETGSPDRAESAPGHQSPAPGGAKADVKDNPGRAESAPGHQSPAPGGVRTDVKDNPGRAESAPGHQSPASGGAKADVKDNPGRAESAPGHQSPASGGVRTDVKDKPGKAESAPAHQSPAPGGVKNDVKDSPGK
ncbi:MAG: hypothetical protein HYX84_03565 [Chloroflexi bacterium]|nr:hypothetical protein [Chloroflexota bacterium]